MTSTNAISQKLWLICDRLMELGLANEKGMVVFTFNVRDFLVLAKKHPRHADILLATQSRWSLAGLTSAIDHALSDIHEKDWQGQVCWLNDFLSFSV